MAMHLHGSFSEGTASMDAHLKQAQRLGVDVLWWTDHDFRVAALGYRRRSASTVRRNWRTV
jgi:predicted metal-dependent phosphoesterase TrpH